MHTGVRRVAGLLAKGEVTVMAAAEHGEPGPDLYQLLGVPRDASREEIAQAWRRRARDEHPDARPADEGAPGRFRALAQAWQVLGDPARRAAYDRALAGERHSAARVPVSVRHCPGPAGAARVTPLGRAGPPLWAGPVRVEGPGPVSRADGWDEEDIRLAMVALRYLGWDWGWPW
jgi:curved DNA-binding protein CbpA